MTAPTPTPYSVLADELEGLACNSATGKPLPVGYGVSVQVTTLRQAAAALREAARLREVEAERDRLRSLLLPFADEAFTYDCDEDDRPEGPLIPDDYFLRIEEGDGTLTESAIRVGHLRKARAALKEPGNG